VSKARKEIFFSGYAKLPAGITATEMYKVIGVVVVIDPETEIIGEADCTLATEVGRIFVKNIMTGYSMAQGIEPLLRTVDARYQGSAKKAIITALKIINDKYRSYKDGHSVSALD
jgi:hypothetical protein